MTIQMSLPYDLRPVLQYTAFTLTSVSTLVVATRFYCRIWIVGRLKVYDYMALFALLSTWGLCVCNYYQVIYGTGYLKPPDFFDHISKEEQEKYKLYRIIGSAVSWYAYHIGYLFTLALIKLSILVFYLSFATQRTFRILVHLSIVIVAAASVAMILVNALQCPKNPKIALTAAILEDKGRQHCLDLRIVFYLQAGFNMVSDLFILVLPLPLFFRLRMHTAKRLSLLAVFCAGLLVPIASGIRFWSLNIWANSRWDYSRYTGGYIILWSQVEINTAIICASLPSLQPLFKQVFHKLPSLRKSRAPYYYYGGGQNSMALSPGAGALRAHRVEHDSIMDLERPAPTYEPKKQMQEGCENNIVVLQHLANDEAVRDRVRAFSNHTSSVHSQPTSPTFPADIFTNR
ncbi:hypothetical protein CC86DRAFT_401372 [Ophiobolus disseminans]|uniref:Rhodopsin domain-containing protein n=1 Tax=Ophiobolus disseminans TaxID=1469910 RepID=A0A6A7AH31_9PLEO|nr:hypothetical protein CC86DRAFT_401372 [Ophiobolus disseminans]